MGKLAQKRALEQEARLVAKVAVVVEAVGGAEAAEIAQQLQLDPERLQRMEARVNEVKAMEAKRAAARKRRKAKVQGAANKLQAAIRGWKGRQFADNVKKMRARELATELAKKKEEEEQLSKEKEERQQKEQEQ